MDGAWAVFWQMYINGFLLRYSKQLMFKKEKITFRPWNKNLSYYPAFENCCYILTFVLLMFLDIQMLVFEIHDTIHLICFYVFILCSSTFCRCSNNKALKLDIASTIIYVYCNGYMFIKDQELLYRSSYIME